MLYEVITIRDEVMHGRGFAVIRGLPVAGYTLEQAILRLVGIPSLGYVVYYLHLISVAMLFLYMPYTKFARITSYNVCYTKLLRSCSRSSTSAKEPLPFAATCPYNFV